MSGGSKHDDHSPQPDLARLPDRYPPRRQLAQLRYRSSGDHLLVARKGGTPYHRNRLQIAFPHEEFLIEVGGTVAYVKVWQ